MFLLLAAMLDGDAQDTLAALPHRMMVATCPSPQLSVHANTHVFLTISKFQFSMENRIELARFNFTSLLLSSALLSSVSSTVAAANPAAAAAGAALMH